MTNKQIYAAAKQLANFSFELCSYIPIRISFYLKRNLQSIQKAYEEIEVARLSIGEQLGTPNEKGTGYDILPENIQLAESELNDLFNLEQELNLHMFKLSDFNDINLTFEQLSAIMFMIEE